VFQLSTVARPETSAWVRRAPRRVVQGFDASAAERCDRPSGMASGDELTPSTRSRLYLLLKKAHSLRSALRYGIREGRCSNQIADVGDRITGDQTFRDTGPDGAVRRAELV
jgi:hypothetical protein